MGTTKLTRKEILGEDPVHEAIIGLIDFFREKAKLIAIGAAILVLGAFGIYYGNRYLSAKEAEAQAQLGKALDFYHARIDASAPPEDPYGKGSEPVFRSENDKYQAASKEFSSIAAGNGSGKVGVTARYYLGLCQMRLGQKDEALKSLEQVRHNTKERTIAYLAKRVLSDYHRDAGNLNEAQQILESMLQDPQCNLPKADLKISLARILSTQGKREDAIKILREAQEAHAGSQFQSQVTQELNRLDSMSGSQPASLPPGSVRP